MHDHPLLSYSLLLALCTISINVLSDIYRYQDDNGRWHYTDSKPLDTPKSLEKLQQKKPNTIDLDIDNFVAPLIDKALCSADDIRRSVYYKHRGGYLGKKGTFDIIEKSPNPKGRSLYGVNGFFIPVEVQLLLTQQHNIKSSPALPLTMLIAPHSSKKITDIAAIDQHRGWSYRFSYRYGLGDSQAQHDNDCYYLPPVPPKNDFVITQAFNGSFSHNSAYSRYAVDIAMPVGTPVLAARDGIVISRQTEHVLAGLSETFKSRANSIAILHGDGTLSVYAHLQFRSIRFHEGMPVKAGDVIARSGNTGYSSGPHLHFEVVKNQRQQWHALPFKFLLDGQVVSPEVGMKLHNKPAN